METNHEPTISHLCTTLLGFFSTEGAALVRILLTIYARHLAVHEGLPAQSSEHPESLCMQCFAHKRHPQLSMFRAIEILVMRLPSELSE